MPLQRSNNTSISPQSITPEAQRPDPSDGAQQNLFGAALVVGLFLVLVLVMLGGALLWVLR